MSEPIYGRIVLGGTLKKELIPELIEALKEDIWTNFSEEDFTDDLEACKETPVTLDYWESEANYGTFESVESFCKQHGLTFTRYSGTSYDCIPETYSWDASNNTEWYLGCDTEEHPVVLKEDMYLYLEAAQDLTKNLDKIPLEINGEDLRRKEVAGLIAKTGLNDPIEVFKQVMGKRYKDPVNVPVLEII